MPDTEITISTKMAMPMIGAVKIVLLLGLFGLLPDGPSHSFPRSSYGDSHVSHCGVSPSAELHVLQCSVMLAQGTQRNRLRLPKYPLGHCFTHTKEPICSRTKLTLQLRQSVAPSGGTQVVMSVSHLQSVDADTWANRINRNY